MEKIYSIAQFVPTGSMNINCWIGRASINVQYLKIEIITWIHVNCSDIDYRMFKIFQTVLKSQIYATK